MADDTKVSGKREPLHPGIRGIVALLVLSAALFVLAKQFDIEQIQQRITAAGPWAPTAYIGLKAATYIIAPLSGGVLHVFAGALFGLPRGVLYTIIGDTIGCSANFLIARYLGQPIIRRLVGRRGSERISYYLGVLDLESIGGLVRARLLLNPAYDFISYAAGLSKVSFRRFFVVSVLGGIPPTVLFVTLGAALSGHSLVLFTVYAGCILLFLVPVVLRARRFGLTHGQRADSHPVDQTQEPDTI